MLQSQKYACIFEGKWLQGKGVGCKSNMSILPKEKGGGCRGCEGCERNISVF